MVIDEYPATVVRLVAAVWNVLCAIVEPFPRTRLVPESAETTPDVLISVPVVKPLNVSAGVVTVPVNVGLAIVAYRECAVVEPSALMKLVAEPADEEITPEPELRRTPAVVSELNGGAELNVCVPVNVCAESVRAIVALVPGRVIVTPSVPVNVMELLTTNFLPEATALSI